MAKSKAPTDTKAALDKYKTEAASEAGVNIKDGKSVTSKQAGTVGGTMVKNMVKDAKETKKSK
ncbi:hypothetical protein FACS1894105_09950 [Clostridia bacterium]|nr:hypothetical protein FACS1894105_09950 [Clostridia bacterium]